MIVRVRGEAVELTASTIREARQWYADNAVACIDEAESGAVKVNDLESYRAWRLECAADSLAGKSDHTLAFIQRALSIQTGECVAILP